MERKKKSRKELVLEQIEKRGLVSYMNTTADRSLVENGGAIQLGISAVGTCMNG